MFIVDTYIGVSEGKGLGVFTKNPIKKGTIIWEFIDGLDIKVHKNIVNELNESQKAFIKKYFWRENDYYYSSCDDSRFQNHSATPNSIVFGENKMIASSDIESGEEILADYSSFDDDYDSYKDQLF